MTTFDSVNPMVVYQHDFANIVGSSSGTEVEVTMDANGQLRFYSSGGGGGDSPGGGSLRCYFHANASSTITMTNQASALQFLAGSNRNIQLADLLLFTQVRVHCRVLTASASANSPRIVAKYSGSFSTSTGDYADLGTSEVSASLDTVGYATSAWIDLAAGAIDDDLFVAVMQIGGDGAADPIIHGVILEFK